jgi:hypothetical protein
LSPPRLKPTPAELERFRVRLARDQESPSGLCWRDRPRSFFRLESDWASWTVKWAWKPAGSLQGGIWRIAIDGAKGRKFTAQDVVAALEAMGPDTLRSDTDALAEGSGGTLADILEDARRGTGMTLGNLTVLSAAHDPYRCAVPKIKREAQWATDRFAEVPASHLRNFHYRLIGSVEKPNGATYSGSNKDWRWLKRATAAARWLRLIPFDALEDRRNGEPYIKRADRDLTELSATVTARFDAEPPSIEVLDGDDDSEMYFSPATYGVKAEQPFIFALFGEKSSLKEEMEPEADRLDADMYLETGEQSITHCYDIARRAAADGRPLVVGVVTDCDPSGWQMAVSIARKLQALRDLEFPTLDVRVIHIGLLPDHVRRFRLPESPISDKEKRKARWKERMGVEQTEIDALLALHRGALGQMIRDAFAPYFDPTLAARVREAESARRAEAMDTIEEALDEAERAWQAEDDSDGEADDNSLPGLKARAEAVSARILELNDDVERAKEAAAHIDADGDDIRDEVEAIRAAMAIIASGLDLDLPDIPEADLPDPPTDGPNMVFNSGWDWVEATERMKARKAYENDDDDDEDEEDEEEAND